MEENATLELNNAAFCASCYTNIGNTDTFCDKCGYPLKGTEEEQQSFINNRTVKEIDLDDYKKKIKTAGNALYWVAVSCVLTGVVLYATIPDAQSKLNTLIINLIIAVIFVALGAWSRKKPLAAILSGAALYVIMQALNLVYDPLSIAKGIFIKIIIVIAFVKGIQSAIEAEKIKKELNVD